jgi:signal transduction histidine kinase
VAISVGDEVVLTVTDDGVGVPEEVLGGRGLTNLANRAEKLDGTFDITAEPTGGSRLTWRVPVGVTAASRDT